MGRIKKMNELLQSICKTGKNFVLFPFAILGLIFIGIFYVIAPIYMLADRFVKDLQSIMYDGNDKDSNASKAIKVLLAFGYVVMFNFVKAILSIPLCIGYFATSILFYLSSFGTMEIKPFAFSEEN